MATRWGPGMPFYIRKSVSAGPLRFDFSTGGVSVSAGVTADAAAQ